MRAPVRRRQFLAVLRVLAALGCAALGAVKPAPAVAQTGAAVQAEAAADAGKPSAKAVAEAQAELKAEKARGKKYLLAAARQKGAIKTKSGMVYIPVKVGTGPSPSAASIVKLDQVARTIDGKAFDESPMGRPADAYLDKVIPCWREGIQRMKVGGKAKLVCPPELAFGDRGAKDHFAPGSTIVYEIELFEIVKK